MKKRRIRTKEVLFDDDFADREDLARLAEIPLAFSESDEMLRPLDDRFFQRLEAVSGFALDADMRDIISGIVVAICVWPEDFRIRLLKERNKKCAALRKSIAEVTAALNSDFADDLRIDRNTRKQALYALSNLADTLGNHDDTPAQGRSGRRANREHDTLIHLFTRAYVSAGGEVKTGTHDNYTMYLKELWKVLPRTCRPISPARFVDRTKNWLRAPETGYYLRQSSDAASQSSDQV